MKFLAKSGLLISAAHVQEDCSADWQSFARVSSSFMMSITTILHEDYNLQKDNKILNIKRLSKLAEFLELEHHNLPFCYVSCYLMGILFYFSLSYDRSIAEILTLLVLAISVSILAFIYRKSGVVSFFAYSIIAFLVGMLISSYRTNSIETISIDKEYKNIRIEGIITKIKPTPYGSQITLSEILTKDTRLESIPDSVRINFAKYDTSYFIRGDRISLKADLFPLPDQIMPGGYNFKQVAYFNKISAVGRAKSDPEIMSYSKMTTLSLISHIRKTIYYELLQNLGKNNGNFAAALLLGETGGIDQTTLRNMRYSGIAHILCVSGLHLSLIAGIFFLTPRILLNFSDYIASRFDIKKIAGCISIIFSFIYLMLTGMQIAATRAFIMTSIVMLSIILERQPYPMRSLSLACFIILTLNPEYAIQPSFQLSFIAVLSLLVGYEFYISSKKILGKSKGILANLKLYLYANIYSSLVASLATSPVVMYHFYVYSNYSIFANLIAVPIVSFILMPAGVMALLLYPLKLSWLFFYLISKSIEIIKWTGQNIVLLPKAIIYTGNINDFAIMVFILSFLWLSIWKSRVRFYGLLGFGIFAISYFTEGNFTQGNFSQGKPDLVINLNSNFIAHHKGNGVTIYSSKINSFTKDFIANWYGYRDAEIIKTPIDKKLCINQIYDRCEYLIDTYSKKILYDNIEYDFDQFSSIFTRPNSIKVISYLK